MSNFSCKETNFNSNALSGVQLVLNSYDFIWMRSGAAIYLLASHYFTLIASQPALIFMEDHFAGCFHIIFQFLHLTDID